MDDRWTPVRVKVRVRTLVRWFPRVMQGCLVVGDFTVTAGRLAAFDVDHP